MTSRFVCAALLAAAATLPSLAFAADKCGSASCQGTSQAVYDGTLRPEIAAYAANVRSAIGMLVHTLHERLGEPQFVNDAIRPYRSASLNGVWARVAGNWSTVNPGPFSADTDRWLGQAGFEVVDWTPTKDKQDRLHIGGMFSFGSADTDAKTSLSPHGAGGEVNGYAFGAYATWYQHDATRNGAYTDIWVQGGKFDSKVTADYLPPVDYDAWAVSASVEAGYAFRTFGTRSLVIEPQAQLIYSHYDQDALIDGTGAFIGELEESIFTSRLGIRLHDTWATLESKYEPFVEVNWWHDFDNEKIDFNGAAFDAGAPDDRFAVGAGLNVEVDRSWSAWSKVEYQRGADDYEAVEAQVGIKFVW